MSRGLEGSVGLCRKVAFLRQNPKIGSWKVNDLRVSTFLFSVICDRAPNIAFPSVRGKPLSREGVDYLLKQAVQRATDACPSLATKTVSPHVVRHTTAMHLLQAGVDIATMALWLGHESIETTHVYLQADLAMKEKALGKLDPIEGEWTRFHADDPLLAFLASL